MRWRARPIVVDSTCANSAGRRATNAVPKPGLRAKAEGIPITYVRRNTIFLSFALGGRNLGANAIFMASTLDYSGCPDCRPIHRRVRAHGKPRDQDGRRERSASRSAAHPDVRADIIREGTALVSLR